MTSPTITARLPALRLGPLTVDPPVVLAPMAGVTNAPFRALCRRYGAGLYVSEMITARALVEGNAKTARMATFGPDESPRSLQLYGIDPGHPGEAVRRLAGEGGVDHIDLNFGCPAPKVTRRGGGAALPVQAGPCCGPSCGPRVGAAEPCGVPVTMKFRMGVDDALLTYLDAGRIAEEEGVAAVALHARTAEQLYSGRRRLVRHRRAEGGGDDHPRPRQRRHLGGQRRPGDGGRDRVRRRGRRPGLPRPAVAVRATSRRPSPGSRSPPPPPPRRGGCRHGATTPACSWSGCDPASGRAGVRAARLPQAHRLVPHRLPRWSVRSVGAWPTCRQPRRARRSPGHARPRPGPGARGLRTRRGHTNGPRPVHLPHRWLDDPDDAAPLPAEADALVSGG